MSFRSLEDILKLSREQNKPFWRVVLEDDMEERLVSEEESLEMMRRLYSAMKDADAAYDDRIKSASGLVGGDGAKM